MNDTDVRKVLTAQARQGFFRNRSFPRRIGLDSIEQRLLYTLRLHTQYERSQITKKWFPPGGESRSDKHPKGRPDLSILRPKPPANFTEEVHEVELPDAGEVRICPGCQGNFDVGCESCKGGGKAVCPACQGTRKRTVTIGVGTQTLSCNCDGGFSRNPCAGCGGRGKVQCPTCFGEGRASLRESMNVTFYHRESADSFSLGNLQIRMDLASKMAACELIRNRLAATAPAPALASEIASHASSLLRFARDSSEGEKALFHELAVELQGMWKVTYRYKGKATEFWLVSSQDGPILTSQVVPLSPERIALVAGAAAALAGVLVLWIF